MIKIISPKNIVFTKQNLTFVLFLSNDLNENKELLLFIQHHSKRRTDNLFIFVHFSFLYYMECGVCFLFSTIFYAFFISLVRFCTTTYEVIYNRAKFDRKFTCGRNP